MPAYFLLIAAAVAGFAIAFYIHQHKAQLVPEKKMFCPLKFECDPVIHSDYGVLLGLPTEIWGMFYYAAIAVTYSWSLLAPWTFTSQILLGVWAISGLAFLFSLYLVYIQAFVLRQWCSWCLASAVLSTLIFFLPLSF